MQVTFLVLSTSTTVSGEELFKEYELLRRNLADCESKLKAPELQISSVAGGEKESKGCCRTLSPRDNFFLCSYDSTPACTATKRFGLQMWRITVDRF